MNGRPSGAACLILVALTAAYLLALAAVYLVARAVANATREEDER